MYNDDEDQSDLELVEHVPSNPKQHKRRRKIIKDFDQDDIIVIPSQSQTEFKQKPKASSSSSNSRIQRINTQRNHNQNQNQNNAANRLLTAGVIVIPILTRAQAETYVKELEKELATAPDAPSFLRKSGLNALDKEHRLVGGGFGALGTVSSFFNPVVRELNSLIESKMKPLWKELEKITGAPYVRYDYDRLMIRPVGTDPGKESWHRDIKPDETFLQFGGWLSLEQDQRFSFIPGSHIKSKTEFEHLFEAHSSKAKKSKLGFSYGFELEASAVPKQNEIIDVPVGHLIQFFSHIVHETIPNRNKRTTRPMIRLFAGFSMSWKKSSVHPKFIEEQIHRYEIQKPLLLPSGQEAQLYPKQYISTGAKILVKLSEPFPNQLKRQWKVASGPTAGTVHTVLKQFANSYVADGFIKNGLYYSPATNKELQRISYHRIINKSRKIKQKQQQQ